MPHADRHALIGFGLSIDSDRAVPGMIPDHAAAAPGLSISTLPAQSMGEPPPPIYRWTDGTLTFSTPGVGCYACRGDAITITPVPDADPETVTALLIATALPAAMWLRGDVMLHAAGVIAPSRQSVLAIAGPSGIGKSALTAQFVDDGGTLAADDSIRLRRGGDAIEASGLPGGYHLGHASDDMREFHRVPAERSVRAARIGAVAILSRTPGPSALIRLNPIQAVERLLANLHRPAIPAALGRRAQALAIIAFIADNCAVYEWRRPVAALNVAERDMLAREGLW